jgi:glyoxylase-like metal-dependent hydrolase (beta-lactamase superfamily II)
MSWTTKNGYKISQVLSGRSNAYLILKNHSVILVDTGKKTAFQALLRNIGSLNVNINNISYLILTHTHFDHCQSAKKIKEKSNCKIIASSAVIDSVKKGYTKLSDGTFLITKLIAQIGRLLGKNKFGYEPFHSDILVKDSYDLKIEDNRIRIMETNGHSADSISILVDNEIAIVGDAIFGVFKNSIFPPYSDDVSKMVESWRKLLASDCIFFLPGHGKEVKRNLLQKEYKKYAQKHNNG